MYLGQESWTAAQGRRAQAAPVARQAQVAHRQPQTQPQPQAPPPPTAAPPPPPPSPQKSQVHSELGDASNFVVGGCVDSVVGPTIRGNYHLAGLNHGKPSYRRDGKTVTGFDVVVFFWDERDGPTNSGWWFAPAIGSEQVWAYHPSRSSTPPTSGWKVPISGPVDTTINLVPGGAGKGGKKGKGKGNYGGQAGSPAMKQQQNVQAQQQRHEREKQARDEAQMKRMEDLKAKQLEQRAWAMIQQVIKKMNNALPETIDAHKKELEEILDKELENCGAQKDTIKSQAEACIKKAEERAAQIVQQREKDEEVRQENERKAKEAQEKALVLLEELGKLAEVAGESAKQVEEVAEPLLSDKQFETETELSELEARFQEVADDARAKLKACTVFMVANQNCLKAAPKDGAQANGEAEKPAFFKLSQKVAEFARSVESTSSKSKTVLQKAKLKVTAKSKVAKAQAAFTKYDSDNDGMLNRKEVTAYAKGEFSFILPQGELDLLFKVLAADGEKAVPIRSFHRLKIMVGIAREKARNEAKKVEREAKEKELSALKAKHQEVIDKAVKSAEAADQVLKEAEALVKSSASNAASKKPEELIEMASKVDELVSSAKPKVEELATHVEALKAGIEEQPALKGWLDAEAKKISDQSTRFTNRMGKAEESATKMRADAKDKTAKELEKMRVAVMTNLRHHLKAKAISVDEMFGAIDTNSDGRIVADDLGRFMPECAKPNGQGVPWSTDDELSQVFDSMDEEDEGFITKEVFGQMFMNFMKVTKEVVLTDSFEIKETNTLRRLDVDECVQILEGPKKEEAADLLRARVKSLKDNAEGWVTAEGNRGKAFLVEGGGFYKVVKETILTHAFDIGAAAKSVKDATVKLKVGDIVEVRETPKKDEATGLLRLKCRHRAPGGRVGWATAVGNSGTVFLQVC